MCLIFGTIIKHHCQETKKILKDLFYYGVHTGNKFFNYALITHEKFLSSPNVDYVHINSIINRIPDNSIFLCYCVDLKNKCLNQPVIQYDTCLLYAGKMCDGTKFDLQKKFAIILRTENEGEVFLTKLQDNTYLDILTVPGVEFFGVWYRNNIVCAVRNEEMPGYWMEKHGNIFFSSVNNIKFDKSEYRNTFEMIPANETIVIGRI